MRGFLSRRFPSPWTSEQIPGGYVVKDAMSLAYVYAGETKAEADTAKVSRTSLARAYAIFGSSCQLIVGPDAATCAVIAAAVAPLAAGDEVAYASLSAMLALLTGLICIAATRPW